MRVVIDARMAASTGIGRYVSRLLAHMPAAGGDDLEMLVAVNPGDPMAWLPDSERIRPVCFERRQHVTHSKGLCLAKTTRASPIPIGEV